MRISVMGQQEAAERALLHFEQACAANQQTTCRFGNVVYLTPEVGDDVFIAADLHNHRPNFEHILHCAALDTHPRRHLILQEVCHGGPRYPNGGCSSHAMLEDVARLRIRYPDRVHFIMSNHELAEITEAPILKDGRMLNLAFLLGLTYSFGKYAPRVHKLMRQFLTACPLGVLLPGGVFVTHSAPEAVDSKGWDPTVLERPLTMADFKPLGAIYRLVWGRDYRPKNAAAFAKLLGAKVLIHGHTPCPAGFHSPNDKQLIIDCCASPAACLLLPLDHELTLPEILERRVMLPTG